MMTGPSPIWRAALLAVVLAAGLAGCLSPAAREATERAWAERDRERAAECAQWGGRWFASACLMGGGP